MTYEVTYRVLGTYSVKVEADSKQEADEKAYEVYAEKADFGDMEEIEEDWLASVKEVFD